MKERWVWIFFHVHGGHIEYKFIPDASNSIQCNVDGCGFVFHVLGGHFEYRIR